MEMKAGQALVEPLTRREMDILQAMAEGLSNAEIARRLVLSPGTVKWYVKQLYGKLGAHSREEALRQAQALGLAAAPAAAVPPQGADQPACPLINPLPLDVSDRYVGNLEKLERLASLLRQPARLVGIYGRAGAGKTALACKALADLRQGAPGLSGIVSLSGAVISLNTLFAGVGRLLPAAEQAALEALARNAELTAGAKTALLLEKIAGRRVVVLLDNLESVQNTETGDLLEASLQQCIEMSVTQSSALTFLITSREPLRLPRPLKTWENLISLEDGLPLEDALALLRRFDPSGLAGLRDASHTELAEVAEKLGGFPRALESVVGMLLEDPLLRLADVRQAVSALEGEVSAAVVEQALAHLSPEARQVLEGLSIYAQPVSYAGLAELLSPYLPEPALHALLGRLVRACFVKFNPAAGLFSLHPIDQAYCYRHIPQGEENGEAHFTRSALHRRAAHYYHSQRLPRALWRRFPDLEPQINEFRHWVLAGAGAEAASTLLEIDRDYLWEWEYKDLLRQLYASLDGLALEPRLALHVARRRAWLKFFDGTAEAEQIFERNLQEARRLGFINEEADALDDLAQICRRGNRDPRQGIVYHRQALELYRQVGDRRGEADALGGLGAIYMFFEPEEAIDYLLAAIDLQRQLGNASSVSWAQTMLGTAYETMGALAQARQLFEEAIQVARQSSSLAALSQAYGQLMGLCVLTGENERIDPLMAEAETIAKEIAGVPLTGTGVFTIGRAGFFKAMQRDFQGGIAIVERLSASAAVYQPHLVSVCNYFLSLIYLLAGQFDKARSLLPMEMLTGLGIGNTYWAGVLLIKTHEHAQAEAFYQRILALSNPERALEAPAGETDRSLLPVQALALACLALLRQQARQEAEAARLASDAARLIRQAAVNRNWQVSLHHQLIDLLMDEPGAEILAQVRLEY